MQRYNIIEKVKEAEVIAILVGTVVVDNYMEIINFMRYAISKSNKKLYEVLIGKLNEPKLKNIQFVMSDQFICYIDRYIRICRLSRDFIDRFQKIQYGYSYTS